jgi:protein TonB
MALELLPNRSRVFAAAVTAAVHLTALWALLSAAPEHEGSMHARPLQLAVIPLTQLPPPPPPTPTPTPTPPPRSPFFTPAAYNATEGAAALRSRGHTEALFIVEPPAPPPLNPPILAETAITSGTSQGSFSGQTSGNGLGQGSEGNGGNGGSGSGSGAGRVESTHGVSSPPVRLAGALTNEDYRRADPPRGAAGVVVVTYRVRTDGRPDACQVVRSSGFAVFDTATCRLIEERFLFNPARDASGREVEWEVRSNYQWVPR